MNYIEQIRFFWRSHEEYSFSTTEIALYFHLLEICNSCQWKNPFKRRNNKIEADLNISYNTLKNSRNRLAQYNIIQFKSQNGNSNVEYTLSKFDEVTNEVSNKVTNEVSNEVADEVKVEVNNEVLDKVNGEVGTRFLRGKHEVLSDININKTKTKLKEEIIEKPHSLVFPFSSDLFFEKWDLLVSSPKWKVKAPQSLQISLDTLGKYDEPFAIEMLNKAISCDWSIFKGFELEEYHKKIKAAKNLSKIAKKDNVVKRSFELFWNLYDKKVGKKEKLAKKWDSLSLTTQDQILEYLPKYIQAVPDKQFRKNPETFLNNDGWNDEIVEITDKSKPKPLVDVKAIERIKNTEEQKDRAKKLKEIIQERVLNRLKSENPNYSITQDFDLWDSTWKNEYVAECKSLGMDKVIYENW